MKITKKILQNIIKEELAKVLQEQDPMEAKKKILQKIKDEIAAVEKQLKSDKTQSDNKASTKRLQDKLKKLKEKLKKKKADLAGPGDNADQSIKEELASILQEQEATTDRQKAIELLAAAAKVEKDPKKLAQLQFALLILTTMPSFSLDPADNAGQDPQGLDPQDSE